MANQIPGDTTVELTTSPRGLDTVRNRGKGVSKEPAKHFAIDKVRLTVTPNSEERIPFCAATVVSWIAIVKKECRPLIGAAELPKMATFSLPHHLAAAARNSDRA
jgi:hypothetical protein